MPQFPGKPEQRFYICPDRFDSNKDIDLSIATEDRPALYLLDGYVHTPPEPETYTIDVPGRLAPLDLTEDIYGGVTFHNRKNEYDLLLIHDEEYETDIANAFDMLYTRSWFEYYKTLLYSFFHGKKFFYTICDENDSPRFRYTDIIDTAPRVKDYISKTLNSQREANLRQITQIGPLATGEKIQNGFIKDDKKLKNYQSRVFYGRFIVKSFEREHYSNGDTAILKLEVDTEPYILYRNIYPVLFTKDWSITKKGVLVENQKCLIGGCEYDPFHDPDTETDNCMPTKPIFKTKNDLNIIHGGKRYFLPPGTWSIPDLILTNNLPIFYMHVLPTYSIKWKEFLEGMEDETRPIKLGKIPAGTKITWGDILKKKAYWWHRYHGWREPIPPTPTSKYKWGDFIHYQQEPKTLTWAGQGRDWSEWSENGPISEQDGLYKWDNFIHYQQEPKTLTWAGQGRDWSKWSENGPISEGGSKQLTGIEIASLPSKLVYNIGDTFDKTGLKVNAVYSDGSKEEVTDYTLSGFDSSTVGSKTITVDYKGYTANFNVTIQKSGEKRDTLWDDMMKESSSWNLWINGSKANSKWGDVYETIKEVYFESKFPRNIQTFTSNMMKDFSATIYDTTWNDYGYNLWFYHKDKTWDQFAHRISPDQVQDVIVYIERGCL